MNKSDRKKKTADLPSGRPFAETRELGHERNEVAQAEKQAASQETAGVMDPQ
ncbi:hypothetical protein [Gorillibacterium sp. sgz5001074]|uniref:hypothetical protein n=1 Tax=Gorillibacterium sp. sgz5001074 TaxID=3446695 RepID=UPI003F6759AA